MITAFDIWQVQTNLSKFLSQMNKNVYEVDEAWENFPPEILIDFKEKIWQYLFYQNRQYKYFSHSIV